MKKIKLLLIAALIQLSFGTIAQTNHVLHFNKAEQEIYLYLLENDTITIINDYQAGDFHYGYGGNGGTILENSFNVQMGAEICKFPVPFSDTMFYFSVFYGSNPGVPFTIHLMKQYLDVKMLSSDYNFSIYPNPTSDYLNIEGENLESVTIYNIAGKLVLTDDSKNKK